MTKQNDNFAAPPKLKMIRCVRYRNGFAEVQHVRRLLNAAGYDASPLDIEIAYGEWCETYDAASWLPAAFFKEKDVDAFVSEFFESVERGREQ